jgi:branched-chain amino acid transport system substrate-binding protein
MATAGKAVGSQVAYSAPVSATATDYTAQCLAAKQAGATVIAPTAATAVSQKVADDCWQQGVKLPQIASGASFAAAVASDPAFAGTLDAAFDAPFFDDAIPAVHEYRAAMQKYAPGVLGTALDNEATEYSWVAGMLFEAAAKAANLGQGATSAQVKDGLYSLKNETLGGLTPPLTFTKGQPTLVNCYYKVLVTGGKLTTPQGATPVCIPPADLAVFKS